MPPSQLPAVRVIRPLYQPLGWLTKGKERHYAIRVGDTIGAWRATQMVSLGWLLDVYPDSNYWCRLFPAVSNRPGRCDPKAAAAWFIREAQRLGQYDGPLGENPTPPSGENPTP